MERVASPSAAQVTRRARRAAALGVLAVLAACTGLDDVPPGAIVTCGSTAECPGGRVCSRSGRCILPQDVGVPPDLVLVEQQLVVTPPSGAAGARFSISVVATKALDGPPRVILGLAPPLELPCAPAGGFAWTCTYASTGDENGRAGGRIAIDVRMVDLEGNEVVKNAVGFLELDFAPPVLAARSAEPASAPLGSVVQVFFATDEALGAAPVLVASRPLGDPAGTRFSPTRQPLTNNYLLVHPVAAADGEGPVTFTVDLTDLVGNAATGVEVGTVVIDPVAPAISSLSASPARLGAAGTLTVTFDSSEPAAGAPSVTVGGRPMACGAYAPSSPRYTCTRAMAGDELAAGTEAVQSIVVGLADAAGNRATASASTIFDLRAPALAGRSADPASVPLGGVILVSLTPDEDLGAAPVLVASRALDEPGGGIRFTPARQAGTRNYLFTHLVTSGDGPGPVEFSVELTDTVGNAATGLSVGTVALDLAPPAITALAASPARLGAIGTLTVTFDVDEPATGGPAVTVGGRPMACGGWATSSPRHTCTRPMAGDELAAGTEAAQSVVVSLADAAGNRATASTSTIFDFRAPALAGASAEPASVPLGGVILVSFTPDEDLGAAPVLVASRPLDEPGGGTRFPLTSRSGTRSYAFTHLVTDRDAPGPLSFTVELTDAVGNAAAGVAVGALTVDLTEPKISSLAVSPARIRGAGTLTVTFDVDEAAAPGSLSVTVGDRAMTCGAYAATSPRYTCTWPMAGDELAAGTEAAQSVIASLADAAGNRATASGSTVFDFRPPGIAAATLAYTPTGGELATVARATAGARVTVTALADEALDPASVPTLVASRGPSALGFAYLPAASTATSAVFEAVVPAGLPDGDYALVLGWTDVAGNAATIGAGLPAVRVKTSTPRLAVNQAAVVFVRSPWGNASAEALGGHTIPAGPYFALEPAEPLSPASRLPAGTFLLDGGAVPTRLEVRAESMVIGTIEPDGDGAWPRRALRSPDTLTAYVVGYDDAGNPSDPVAIGTVEWVATSNLPAIGETPHVVRRTPLVQASREQRTEVESVAAADVSGADRAAALAVAQGIWRKMTFGTAERVIEEAALAYDSARGRVVLFGGRLGSSPLQGIREWDGSVWTDLTPLGTKPEARTTAGLAYDGARGRVVLFGGKGGNALYGAERCLGDTWEWDGARWEERTPGAGPSPRCDVVMTYDSARRRVVLHGGTGDDWLARGDTWEWDGASWTEVVPAGGSPGPRPGAPLVYDPARERTVLVGDGEVWEWDGASWSSTTVAGGPASGGVATFFDVARGRVVSVGVGVVWEWNGATWTERSYGGPTAPWGGPVAHDAVRGRTVVVRGAWGSASPGTWEWDGTGWIDVTPTGLKPPPGYMYENALAYDTARRRMVLHGGSAGTATWEWNGAAWRNVTPAGASPPQWPSNLAYDPVRQRTVLLSGGQTWEWDGATWTGITPTTQPDRALAWDGNSRRVVALAGLAWTGADWIPFPAPGGCGGLAAWDGARGRLVAYGLPMCEWDGAAWADATPVGTTPPQRWDAAMTADSERGRTILFGGALGGGVMSQDTWEWDGSAWRDVTTAGIKPPARRFHSLAYDSDRKRTVLFSGNDAGGDVYWDDTWELEARLSGRPAIQLDVSMARTGIALAAVTGLRVRAYAGGAFTHGDPGSAGLAGATLRGWATHAPAAGPGGWIALATNGASASAQPPHLGPPGTTLVAWSAASAGEARRFVTERDGALAFQVVPSGTMGPDPGGARVALDYVEVRVRYAVPPR